MWSPGWAMHRPWSIQFFTPFSIKYFGKHSKKFYSANTVKRNGGRRDSKRSAANHQPQNWINFNNVQRKTWWFHRWFAADALAADGSNNVILYHDGNKIAAQNWRVNWMRIHCDIVYGNTEKRENQFQWVALAKANNSDHSIRLSNLFSNNLHWKWWKIDSINKKRSNLNEAKLNN